MKNKFKYILLFIIIIIVTGCTENKVIICESNINNYVDNYILKGIYKIYYDNRYVTKIEEKEEYISSNSETLNYFKDSKEIECNYYNTVYGKTICDIKLENSIALVSRTLHIKVMDVKKMVSDNILDKEYLVNDKLTTSGAKAYYMSKSAVCEEK